MRVNAILSLTLIIFLSTAFSEPITNRDFYQLSLKEKAKKLKLWEDKYWIKLLYYENGIFRKYKSQNINPKFFLSKFGKYSPESELLKDISSIFELEENKNLKCSFPQRYKWLKEKLDIDESILGNINCNDFLEWKKILNPYKVYIVFASGYISNPSTLYGHTFLILRNPENKNSLLLDYAVSYAATTGDEKGFTYAFKGVFGLYPGNFTTMPYYLKIQEYQNMENRDLWEYELNLTDDEIDNLLNHLWELGKASFPYYFFSKNCSWQLLPLFEIVRPGLELKDKFIMWNIPYDTLKIIVENLGDKNNFTYRPSLMAKLKSKISNLTKEEQKKSIEISKNKENIKFLDNIENKSKMEILDAASDYLSFLYHTGNITQKEMDIRMDPLLLEMSKINISSNAFVLNISTPQSPVESRESSLLSIGIGRNRDSGIYDIRFRPALSELLDLNDGYLDNSVLEMGNLRLRYISNLNKIYIKNLTLVNVLSLNPIDDWFKETSWGIKFGYMEYDRNYRKQNDGMFHIETSRGYSFNENIFNINTIIFALLQINFDYSPIINKNFRYGAGPYSGIWFKKDKIRFLISSSYTGFKNDKAVLKNEISFSYIFSKDTSAVLSYMKTPKTEDLLFNINYFFFP